MFILFSRTGSKNLCLILLSCLCISGLQLSAGASPSPLQQLESHSKNIHSKLRPSVVSILCEVKGENNPRKGPYYGTGVIISSGGYILSSTSVVPPGAEDIRIVLHDRKRRTATLVGASLRFEISLLKMEGSGYQDIGYGKSENLSVGSQIYSAGNAFGLSHQQGHISFSSGIVSGSYPTESVYWQSQYKGLQIEVDSSINPGTDGGPIVDRKGRLVGIISLTADRARWMGMAVPVHLFQSYTGLLRSYHDQEVDRDDAKSYLGLKLENIRKEDPEGVRVKTVTEKSPAWFAGLREGDLIYQANGKEISDLSDFGDVMQDMSIGDQFLVYVQRNNQRWSILMRVGAEPL